jgi:hypothetical protein
MSECELVLHKAESFDRLKTGDLVAFYGQQYRGVITHRGPAVVLVSSADRDLFRHPSAVGERYQVVIDRAFCASAHRLA